MAFNKYKKYGPYHWAIFTKDPRRHDLFTYTRYQAVLDNVNFKEGMNILDIGCGDGALTYLLFKKCSNCKITGIEPDEIGRNLAIEMLAKKKAQVEFLESSAEVLDKSQDLIVCADVIEHVSNCDDFLMEIKRMLKPHGRAVLSTPVRITERPADDEHVMEFFPDEFNKLVRKYFIIDNHSYCISVFALDLYTWKPSFFLKRALIGWLMSSLNILLGCNVMKRMSSNNNLWTTQVINGIDGG